MAKHIVARGDEIKPGERKLVLVKGRPILVLNIDGAYFGLLNRCPHRGGDLDKGRLGGLLLSQEPGQYEMTRAGEILRCPWHGWEFDVKTGKSWCRPDEVKARQYAVTVEPGAALVEGPHVAETFEVSVEGEYVVVEL